MIHNVLIEVDVIFRLVDAVAICALARVKNLAIRSSIEVCGIPEDALIVSRLSVAV